MHKLARCTGVGFLLLLTTCSYTNTETVRVRLAIGKHARLASDVTGFSCFGLLVTGPRIPSITGTAGRLPSTFCSYPGVASKFITLAQATEVEVKVPTGDALIQVVALETNSAGVACPTGTVSEFLYMSRTAAFATNHPEFQGLYEVGQARKNLTTDLNLDIANIYDASARNNLRGCDAGVPSVALYPTPPASGPLWIEQGGQVDFKLLTAASPANFTFALAGTPNSTITAAGAFTATNNPNMADTLEVRDLNLGVVAAASLKTFAPPATPFLWVTGGALYGTADGAALTGTLTNRGSTTAVDHLSMVNAGLDPLYVASGPNGFGAVNVRNTSNMHRSLLANVNLASAGTHIFVVAKVGLNAGTGPLFCLSQSSSCDGSGNYASVGIIAFSSASNVTLFGKSYDTSGVSVAANRVLTGTGYFLAELQGSFTDAAGMVLTAQGTDATSASINGRGFTANSGSGYAMVGLGGNLTADVAEVMVFNLQLTVAQAGLVRNYLQSKYNLP